MAAPVVTVGRYALRHEIASGGMAVVHLGRLLGPAGFSRTVAIKRLHRQFARDARFVSMFVDEARLAARIRHPNVVQTLDVVATRGELFLVMDYVQGESLSRLLRTARADDVMMPVGVALGIGVGVLHGLHAAHEAKSERGEPLNIVHRDVSPQNVIVGTDGVPRVLDFGVAKAAGRVHNTRDGTVKGKLAYMAPEQLAGTVSRQSDIFAASIVIWETLTGARLFDGSNEGEILTRVVSGPIQAPSTFNASVSPALDAVVLRGLERDATKRFQTAREMAVALERLGGVSAATDVGDWVERVAHRELARRADLITAIETETDSSARPIEIGRELRDEATKPVRPPPPSVEDVPFDEDAPTLAQHTPSHRMAPVGAAATRIAEDPSSASIASASAPPAPPTHAPRNRAVFVIPIALVAIAGVVGIGVSIVKSMRSDDGSTGATTGAAGQPTSGAASTTTTTTATATATLTATTAKATVDDEPSGSAAEELTEPTPAPTPTPTPTPKTPPAATIKPTSAPTSMPTPTATSAPKPPIAKTAATGPTKPTATKPNCDPKYTIDAKGVKVWKPECF